MFKKKGGTVANSIHLHICMVQKEALNMSVCCSDCCYIAAVAAAIIAATILQQQQTRQKDQLQRKFTTYDFEKQESSRA
jgi:hypothetical protein